MDDETREKLKAAAKRRALCPQCQNMPEERDGREVGGLPGVTYRYCNACGWCRAKTKRQRRFGQR